MEIAKIVQKQKTVLSDSHLVEFLTNISVILNMDHGYVTTAKLRSFWVPYGSSEMQNHLTPLPEARVLQKALCSGHQNTEDSVMVSAGHISGLICFLEGYELKASLVIFPHLIYLGHLFIIMKSDLKTKE